MIGEAETPGRRLALSVAGRFLVPGRGAHDLCDRKALPRVNMGATGVQLGRR